MYLFMWQHQALVTLSLPRVGPFIAAQELWVVARGLCSCGVWA